MSDETRQTWSEAATDQYLSASTFAVPSRAEQLAYILSLLPFSPDEEFTTVELGCGEGFLSRAILDGFPQARLIALDGSEQMRAITAERLSSDSERVEIHDFDLLQSDWRSRLDGVDAVVSSLVIHHLDDEGKRAFYAEVHQRVSKRAVFLIADLLAPANTKLNRHFAETYDAAALEQSRLLTGDDAGYQRFLEAEWNFYRYPDPYSDRPARLFDQLCWLDEAGFAAVDCFWMRAGHAIFGGFVAPEVDAAGLSYDEANEIATRVLGVE